MGPGAKADHEAEIKEVIEGASLPALEETLAAPAAVSTSTLNLMDDMAALVISPSLGGGHGDNLGDLRRPVSVGAMVFQCQSRSASHLF
jgi:hypothetical protein